jgi:hypothetical protein
MLRNDIDGILSWVKVDGEPALILEYCEEMDTFSTSPNGKGVTKNYGYQVFTATTNGEVSDVKRFKSLRLALEHFASKLPIDEDHKDGQPLPE